MKQLLTIIGLLSLVSCASTRTWTSKVSSMTEGTLANKTYFITPLYKRTNPGSIEYRRFSKIVNGVLSRNGLVKSDKSPEIVVRLGYGINSRTEIDTYEVPKISTLDFTTNSGYGSTDINTTGTVTTTETRVDTYTVYDRHILLSFVDYKHYIKTNEIREISTLKITSTGGNRKLEKAFPIIMSTALPFIGSNGSGRVHVEFDKYGGLIGVTSRSLTEKETKKVMKELSKYFNTVDDPNSLKGPIYF